LKIGRFFNFHESNLGFAYYSENTESENLFQPFKLCEMKFSVFNVPYIVYVTTGDEDMQREIMGLLCDSVLKEKISDGGILSVYTYRYISISKNFSIFFSNMCDVW
jgi:hypothetical protein